MSYSQTGPKASAAGTRRTESELVNDVIKHWFGSTSAARYDPLKAQCQMWYSSKKEVDDDIRQRFGDDVERALAGGWDHLIGNSDHPITGELALVVLLDQYTRNIYRGSGQAFAGDQKSLQVADTVLAPGKWKEAQEMLPVMERIAFLMPLMHQESVEQLDRCKRFFKELIAECEAVGDDAAECANFLRGSLKFADGHRDILVRFGRYPYRNDCLGRQSTSDELVFLEKGPRYGQ